MPVRVVDVTQRAEAIDLHLAPDVLLVPTTPGDLTTRAVAAPGGPRLLLNSLYGSLPVWRLDKDSTPDGNSVDLFGVREGPPLGDAFGDGD